MVPFSIWFWPIIIVKVLWSFSDGSEDKESACNSGDTGNMGSITESGRSPGEEMATHSSILVWEIPLIEEPGWLQSMGLPRVGQDWSHVNYNTYKRKIIVLVLLTYNNLGGKLAKISNSGIQHNAKSSRNGSLWPGRDSGASVFHSIYSKERLRLGMGLPWWLRW